MGIVIAVVYFTKAKLSIMPIRLKGKLGNIRCIHHRALSPRAACPAPSMGWDCSSVCVIRETGAGQTCNCSICEQKVSRQIVFCNSWFGDLSNEMIQTEELLWGINGHKNHWCEVEGQQRKIKGGKQTDVVQESAKCGTTDNFAQQAEQSIGRRVLSWRNHTWVFSCVPSE